MRATQDAEGHRSIFAGFAAPIGIVSGNGSFLLFKYCISDHNSSLIGKPLSQESGLKEGMQFGKNEAGPIHLPAHQKWE